MIQRKHRMRGGAPPAVPGNGLQALAGISLFAGGFDRDAAEIACRRSNPGENWFIM
ncbi:hypothetical protein KYK29_14670 [Shinella daejeonensis]|uniref:hypothetical protein n=1 Tax=Shinella daejeonensis TaxID=659017 RepID=UPI0020C81DAC|nr:hypothetical protein [Shinella daejeonensis]MCP8896172.1 hypothetical protein [Shinella daejeonensis]